MTPLNPIHICARLFPCSRLKSFNTLSNKSLIKKNPAFELYKNIHLEFLTEATTLFQPL